MEDALAKIRPHVASNLAHQKTPATLLVALESTMKDQSTDPTPTAYFAVTLTTLESTIQKKQLGLQDADILPAELYILALVMPFVPQQVIRGHLSTFLELTANLFPLLKDHAPPLRSQLTMYGYAFQALDRSGLDTPGVRQTFASVLQYAADPRPKVRKKAADVIRDTLLNPPNPLVRHPYGDQVAKFLEQRLTNVLSTSGGKGKSTEGTSAETALHILAFVRPILEALPASALPELTNLLLQLPRLGNPYLSSSSYTLLADVLGSTSDPALASSLPQILNVVLASVPPTSNKANLTLIPPWLTVVANAARAYYENEPKKCQYQEGPRAWAACWEFLSSPVTAIRQAAADALSMLVPVAPPTLLADTNSALDSLTFARYMPELLSVVAAILAFGDHAQKDGLNLLIQKVGQLRNQASFEAKESADAVLATAIRIFGPHVVLSILPLNLEPEDRKAGREPRAHLLPLLTQSHPSPLGHFVSYFVPLSERMFNLAQEAESAGRSSEVKVWTVLVAQIWAGFSGYCHTPSDLEKAFNPEFSALLSQVLYTQPELRSHVLRALKIIVESSASRTVLDEDEESESGITPAQAQKNIAFLQQQSESWLAVLFNVFGSTAREARGMVGDVISTWASIADEQVVSSAYTKVAQMFEQNLAKADSANGDKETGSLAAMTQDLLILLIPYLSPHDAGTLFDLMLQPQTLSSKDNGVQKRGYKILSKIISNGKAVDIAVVLQKLEMSLDALTPAAKKDRFTVLSQILPSIPSTSMHIIPSLIPEAVLGTKEPSEKSRLAAFDLIVAMGERMKSGGTVRMDLIDGMDQTEDGPREAAANVEEFVTMVAGGLAGASPHMISATITAISRLVFEFKDDLSAKMQSEIFTTLLVFLSSANREIIKSTLGYIKLSIHTLSLDLLRPHLPQLVPALLRWAHDHKNHFKAKVRHIFERLLRRFRWDEVYGCAGEEEAAKVLVNIRKRKERAKRKKAREEEEDGEQVEQAPQKKAATGNAFEDVLYGSESELDSDDDEQAPTTSRGAAPKKGKHNETGARLRVDVDEPTDLLQGVASLITQHNQSQGKKRSRRDDKFKTDDDSGKMVIDEDPDSDIEENARRAANDVAGTAYRESLVSADGFKRLANGRVKFNKDTKKRRRDNADDDMDVDAIDAQSPPKSRKTKGKVEPKLGHEFKAKRAGGDIKKGGVDPYAYMTLSQAAKKTGRGGHSKIGIARR